jgi:hypothetical protein
MTHEIAAAYGHEDAAQRLGMQRRVRSFLSTLMGD